MTSRLAPLSSHVLVSHQRFEVPELGIARRVWAATVPGVWLHFVKHRGMGADESLAPGLGYGRSPTARVVVSAAFEGPLFTVYEGVTRTWENSVITWPSRASFRSGIVPNLESCFSMTVEIDRTLHPGPDAVHTSGHSTSIASLREAARSVTRAIEASWNAGEDRTTNERLTETIGAFFARIEAEGFAMPTHDSLRDAARQAPRRLAAIGRGVDRSVSQTSSMPMLIDIERVADCSGRTAQRAFPELCAAWGRGPESFRDYRRRIQIAHGVGAMSARAATTTTVSRALGFSNPNAFCRALAAVGLPPPREVATRFAAMQ